MDLTTRGFHHVTLAASDAARTLAFYRDVLGLVPQGAETGGPAGFPLYVGDEAGRPGTLLAFDSSGGAPPGRPGIGGVHHVAFGVGTDEALLQWKRRLADHGVPATGPYDRGYFTSLYFRDPDGQILEIATAGPGYAIDEPADALGRELLHPPRRIVRGHRDEAAIAALTWPEPVPAVTPEMALHGLHHVSAITDDLGRAGEFYEAALGLRLVKRTTNRDAPDMPHYFWAAYDGRAVAPHSAWTLFGFPPHWNRVREGLGQARRVAFRAADEAELRAWTDHLRSLAIETEEEGVDDGPFRGIRFRAPDGQPLEIAVDGARAG